MPRRNPRGATTTLLAAATEGIARLNARYPSASGADRFLLLHRRRLWNAAQGRWMGWERKRGKLHELNRLLRGSTDTTFLDRRRPAAAATMSASSSRSIPTPGCRATRSTGWSARWRTRSTGPRFDPAEGRVVEGYGVLQPRVAPSLPVGSEGSLFQRIFSSNSGIDPYSSAVSDVYQDLFGEGSYSGKGIYDIDAFEAALAGRVPDNSMLSHDLFEGVFARSGLVTDIEVVEEFPARYDVAAARHHRWARGDWQLLPWMLGLCKGPRGDDVPAIGFWKMFDNLRRTLSPAAAVVALLAGWTLPLPGGARLDGFRPAGPGAAHVPAGGRGAVAAPCRHHDAQPSRRAGDGHRHRLRPDRADRGLPRPSGLADDGCDRPDPLPALRQPSPAARVDDGGPDQAVAAHRLVELLSARWRAAWPSPRWRLSSSGMPAGARCPLPCRSCWPGFSRRRSPAG